MGQIFSEGKMRSKINKIKSFEQLIRGNGDVIVMHEEGTPCLGIVTKKGNPLSFSQAYVKIEYQYLSTMNHLYKFKAKIYRNNFDDFELYEIKLIINKSKEK